MQGGRHVLARLRMQDRVDRVAGEDVLPGGLAATPPLNRITGVIIQAN